MGTSRLWTIISVIVCLLGLAMAINTPNIIVGIILALCGFTAALVLDPARENDQTYADTIEGGD